MALELSYYKISIKPYQIIQINQNGHKTTRKSKQNYLFHPRLLKDLVEMDNHKIGYNQAGSSNFTGGLSLKDVLVVRTCWRILTIHIIMEEYSKTV